MGLFNLRTSYWFFLLVLCFNVVSAEEGCFGAGAIATSVVLSVLVTLLIIGAIYYWMSKRARSEHLILETDPEKGKAEYAFDNPGFKDAGLTPLSKTPDSTIPKIESENSRKQKWNHWPKLSALTNKSEKRKTLDDSVISGNEVKVVALKSHDFTGLGFGICGNMKEGIFVKDILHRGPASESGKLNIGDRINSVTISFEHMVYEDALSILSYASPYEIIIEAKSAGAQIGSSAKGNYPIHPIYRSSSSTDLQQIEKSSRRKLYSETSVGSNSSTLHKSISNMTTLERRESKSPKPYHIFMKNCQNNNLNSDQLRNQLEQRITSAETEARLKNEPVRVEMGTQKSENKHQKFGIKVFPTEEQKSPKTNELSQNDNNLNIEKNIKIHVGIDEVDSEALSKRKEEDLPSETFKRNDSLNGSGLKRDSNGIPQEIPSHMLNAAVAARRNRKSVDETPTNEEDAKFPKKLKGKAPPPPDDKLKTTNLQETAVKKPTNDLYEIKQIDENYTEKKHTPIAVENSSTEKGNGSSTKSSLKEYNSDSDEETDNHSSVNTIELNSSDITIHHEENEEKQNRKTASTGDLSKIHKTRKSSTGTLERAQSLDITDSGIPTLKRKGGRLEDTFDMNSDEDIFGKAMINKEPRLSLILDGLNTFQRNRLKKSTEWGNLEDAILKSGPDNRNESVSNFENSSVDNMTFNFGEKTAEFSALVNRINEIRKESEQEDNKITVIPNGDKDSPKNEIWPSQIGEPVEIKVSPPREIKQKISTITTNSTAVLQRANGNVRNEIWPKELGEKNEIGNNEIGALRYSNGDHNILTERNDKKSNIIEMETIEITALPNQEKIDTKIDKSDLHSPNEEKRQPITIEDIIKSLPVELMLESETPPDAVLEVCENPEETNKIKVSNDLSLPEESPIIRATNAHSKVQRRQQIPSNNEEFVPPPEIVETNLEDEIFEQLRRNHSTSDSETDTTTNPRMLLLSEASTSASSSSAAPPNKNKYSNNSIKRNSETGEMCSVMNGTDESKTISHNTNAPSDETENFIFRERYSYDETTVPYQILPEDINISDDIKVSRHSLGSLEMPKSDDAKSIESIKYSSNISNVTINSVQTENGSSSLHSLEFSINQQPSSSEDTNNQSTSNEDGELYTTALNRSLTTDRDTSKIIISTPDLIKNVTITEAINTLNNDMDLNLENMKDARINNAGAISLTDNNTGKNINNHSSLTYITEIQVTPNNGTGNMNNNVSEIEILPINNENKTNRSFETFDNYVKTFEVKNHSNDSMIDRDVGENVEEIETTCKKEEEETKPQKIDPEKQLHKIQEIAQEQLKKLPEMRFSTSSYESASRIPEKRQSQVELLKSNFEKNSPKKTDTLTKSRIPISATMKTPPTSPERRDSRNLDVENEREIIELMSSTVHSTPMTNNSLKYQLKSPNKNVTVTSIRSNSKIPSGLPILAGNRPPVPKKPEQENGTIVQVSSNNINSFKQWVFDPVDSVGAPDHN